MREPIFDKKRKELITLPEAQDLGLGLANTLKVQILKGRRKAIKIGKSWLIRKEIHD